MLSCNTYCVTENIINHLNKYFCENFFTSGWRTHSTLILAIVELILVMAMVPKMLIWPNCFQTVCLYRYFSIMALCKPANEKISAWRLEDEEKVLQNVDFHVKGYLMRQMWWLSSSWRLRELFRQLSSEQTKHFHPPMSLKQKTFAEYK